MKIWTEAYSPFIMGGDVNQPISTDVEVGELFELGKGIWAYLVPSPKGEVFIIESESGALLGTDVEKIKKDVSDSDMEVMLQQIKDAKERAKKTKHLNKDDFWGKFR